MPLKSARFKGDAKLEAAANGAAYIKWGARGAHVATVQKAYVDLGFSMPNSTLKGGGMDGIFGQETYSVTRHFQKKHSLGIDGVIGKQTMTKLDDLFAAGPGPGPGPGPVVNNPRFEMERDLNGFDHRAVPNWQMVPLNGFKLVYLRDGDHLTVVSQAPGVCSVHEVMAPLAPGSRLFELRGHTKANTQIHAKDGGTIVKRLDVSVKSKKPLTISFHYVKDNAGHATTRRPADLQANFDRAKRVFLDQINVELIKKSVTNSYQVNQDLGNVIIGAHSAAPEWRAVIANRDNSVDLNVFFVWEFNVASETRDDAEAGTAARNSLVEDNIAYEMWNTLSHEIGHHLGVGSAAHAGTKDLLMSGPNRTNVRIPKGQANTMNP